jgi:tellurite resistance protein TehA-like permease
MPHPNILPFVFLVICTIIGARFRRANPEKFEATLAILAALFGVMLGSLVVAVSIAVVLQDHLLIPSRRPNHAPFELALALSGLLLGLVLFGLVIWIFFKRRNVNGSSSCQ